MGFLDKIFGSQEPKNKIQQVSTLTAGQNDLLTKLTDILKGQIGGGIQPYSGTTVAPTNALQSGVFGAASGIVPGATKALDAYGATMDYYDPSIASKVLGKMETNLDDILKKFDPQAANEAFTAGVQTPTIKAWERDVLPKIMERFAGANAGDSGAINRSITRSGSDLMSSLGSTRASSLYDAENAYENRRLQALGLVPELATAPAKTMATAGAAATLGTGLLSSALGIGGTERGIEQEKLDEILAKYEQGQAYNNPWLKFLPTALNTSAFDTLVTPRLSNREETMNNIGLGSDILMGIMKGFMA